MATAFDAHEHPDRLNLGCGWDIRDGFLNVDLHDFHKPELVADVTDLAMLPSGHYVEIVAQDVLEHLPRQKTTAVLGEWSRLLQPGGTLELRVPSIIGIAQLMQAPEYQTVPQQELMVQCLFGTQAYSEDCHYTTFTEPLLRHYLAEAGLDPTEFALRDGWLFEVTARKLWPGEELLRDPFGDETTSTVQQMSDTSISSAAASPRDASVSSAAPGRSSVSVRRLLRLARDRVRVAFER